MSKAGVVQARSTVGCAWALLLWAGCAEGTSTQLDPAPLSAGPAAGEGAMDAPAMATGEGSATDTGDAAVSDAVAALEPCSMGDRQPCDCAPPPGSVGEKVCVADLGSPTGGFFTACRDCEAPSMDGAADATADGGDGSDGEQGAGGVEPAMDPTPEPVLEPIDGGDGAQPPEPPMTTTSDPVPEACPPLTGPEPDNDDCGTDGLICGPYERRGDPVECECRRGEFDCDRI